MKEFKGIKKAVRGTYPKVFKGVTVETTIIKRGRIVNEGAK